MSPGGEGIIKALTLFQPWATLIAIGAKRVETRSWSTRYRGPLAIHAGATRLRPQEILDLFEEDPRFRDALIGADLPSPFTVRDFPRSAIVAVARIHECRPAGEYLVEQHRGEYAFGDFRPGRVGWLLADVKPLRTPVPAIGARGLWDVPADLEARIREAL